MSFNRTFRNFAFDFFALLMNKSFLFASVISLSAVKYLSSSRKSLYSSLIVQLLINNASGLSTEITNLLSFIASFTSNIFKFLVMHFEEHLKISAAFFIEDVVVKADTCLPLISMFPK